MRWSTKAVIAVLLIFAVNANADLVRTRATGGGGGVATAVTPGTTTATGCQNLVLYGDNSQVLNCEAALGYTASNDTLTVGTAGRVLLGSGTAGAPSWAWAADDDATGTGMYRTAADQIGVSIGGTLRWFWSSTDFAPNSLNTASIGNGTSSGVRVIHVGTGVEGATTKTLTDNTIASFMRVACASGDGAAGTVDFTAYAENGTTESQSMTGTVQFSCLNPAGTEVCPTPTVQGTPLHNETTGGTADLTVAWACDTSPTNAVDLRVTVDTGIATPTAVELRYRMNVVSGSPTLTAQ
jgi:hypothetical protein